jgi:hypothetical protein
MTAKRPRGRPSSYSQEVAAEICTRLAKGESLLSICEDDHLPEESTVRHWAVENREGFFADYTRARDIGLDARADRIERRFMSEPDTARARLIFDHDRWYLSKMAPKRYGDKLTHAGDEEAPIKVERIERVIVRSSN